MKNKREQLIRIAVLFLVLICAVNAEAVSDKLETALIVSEEYTDNLFLENTGEQEEYITRIRPQIKFDHESAVWKILFDYTFDYRIFGKNSRDNDTTHILRGQSNIEILKNFFYLDVKDDYKRVSIDISRDFTEESLIEQQSDKNVFDASPYFLLAPTSTARIYTGYRYRNIWYEVDNGVDKEDNIAYLIMEFDLTASFLLRPGYRYIDESSDAKDFRAHDAFVEMRYEYDRESRLYGKIGYGNVEFEDKDKYDVVYWTAGLQHTFTTSSITMETLRDFDENPTGNPNMVDRYRIILANNDIRSNQRLSASYNEFTDTVTEELERKTHSINADIGYKMTPRLALTLLGSYNKYEYELSDSYSQRYIGEVSFNYDVYEKYAIRLAYLYTKAYSPEIDDANYESNRAIIELKKNF